MSNDRITYTTKAWPRGQSSVASTVPKQIRAIKGAPPADEMELHWSINPDTGAVEVEFVRRDEEDETDE
jgi:hypothetical protein